MSWWLSGSVYLRLLIGIAGCLSFIAVQPGWAEEKSNKLKLTAQQIFDSAL